MTEKFYADAEFVGRLPGYGIDVRLLSTLIGELTQSTPVVDVRIVTSPASGVVVEWENQPTTGDVDLVDAVVAAFPGGLTSSDPIRVDSLAVETSSSPEPVTKIDHITPALDEGTYLVTWAASLQMQEVIADTRMRAELTLTRSDDFTIHQVDAWDRAEPHAFNGATAFIVATGQRLSALLAFSRLGSSGVAEMSGARITIDKIR